ncbi:MAG: cohesin domain-containing protein, partial [Bacteroidota bacterium]
MTISSQAIPIEFTSSTGSVNDFDLTTGIVNQGMGNQPTCTDGMQNGNETGVDCGGPDCPTCPTCNDGVQNGNETGIDCGGPDCPACPATCSDGIQNGNETGVDCGGPDCPACPTCNDGIQNGNETGIDCGGSCQPCSSGSQCGDGSNDLTLCVGEVCGDIGEQVCVDIEVGNFTNVAGVDFRINYAGGNLEYVPSATVFNSSLNGAGINGNLDGQLRMLWFDPQLNPTSIPDGEALVTVCFQIENDLNTPINLSLVVLVEPSGEAIDPVIVNPGAVNGPSCGGVTPTCNDGIQNGNETGVDCGGPDCPACPTCNDGIQNGNETGVDCGGSCTPCTGNGDEVTFSLNTVTGMAGDQVCLNVTVANFTAIAAFQYSINYDPAILQFTQVTNLAFPDINVVQPVSTPGEIRTSWNYFQPDNLGETLP